MVKNGIGLPGFVAEGAWVCAAVEKMLEDSNVAPGCGKVEREPETRALEVHVNVRPIAQQGLHKWQVSENDGATESILTA